MGIPRRYCTKARTRPKKSRKERERRGREHQKRLIALGMSQEAVSKLNAQEIRHLLKYPKRIAKA